MRKEVIYLMTCITLSNPENMKPLLRTAIKVITPLKLEEDEYAAHKFCLVLGEPGTTGAYMLPGLSPGSRYHMCLRDILLVKPDSAADSSVGPKPCTPSLPSKP
jgi:hypothetical protein